MRNSRFFLALLALTVPSRAREIPDMFGEKVRIKAVRNEKVYLIPNQPFDWFERPPSFMCLPGAKWLAHLLYPERYRTDIIKRGPVFLQALSWCEFEFRRGGKAVTGTIEYITSLQH